MFDWVLRRFCGLYEFKSGCLVVIVRIINSKASKKARNYAENVLFRKMSTTGNQAKLRYFSQCVLAVPGMKFQRYLRSKTDKLFKIFLINDKLFVLTQLQDLFKRIMNDPIKVSKTFHSILLPDIRNI